MEICWIHKLSLLNAHGVCCLIFPPSYSLISFSLTLPVFSLATLDIWLSILWVLSILKGILWHATGIIVLPTMSLIPDVCFEPADFCSINKVQPFLHCPAFWCKSWISIFTFLFLSLVNSSSFPFVYPLMWQILSGGSIKTLRKLVNLLAEFTFYVEVWCFRLVSDCFTQF